MVNKKRSVKDQWVVWNNDVYDYPDHILRMLEQSENYKLEWNYEEALAISQKIVVEDAECIPALEEIADNLLSLDKVKESEKTIKYIFTLTESSYTANYIYWFLLSKKWKFSDSVIYLENANRLKQNNAEILRCLWWSLFMSSNKKRWLLILERARNLFPGDVMILCDLAVCYLDLQEDTKAINTLLKAKEIDPNDERVIRSMQMLNNLRKVKDNTV